MLKAERIKKYVIGAYINRVHLALPQEPRLTPSSFIQKIKYTL